MKKIVFIIMTALFCATQLQAQSWRHSNSSNYRDDRHHASNNIYYGLRLGFGLASVNSDDEYLDAPGSRTGLNIGAVVGYQLSSYSPVYLESGLYYTEKGGKNTNNGSKLKYNLNYLKLPVVVKYAIDIDNGINLIPYAGGYLACGVGGKIKNYRDRESMSAFSHDYFKRFDGGLTLGFGASFDVFYADMSYDFGLANICHDDFGSSRNNAFYLNIGVNF